MVLLCYCIEFKEIVHESGHVRGILGCSQIVQHCWFHIFEFSLLKQEQRSCGRKQGCTNIVEHCDPSLMLQIAPCEPALALTTKTFVKIYDSNPLSCKIEDVPIRIILNMLHTIVLRSHGNWALHWSY